MGGGSASTPRRTRTSAREGHLAPRRTKLEVRRRGLDASEDDLGSIRGHPCCQRPGLLGHLGRGSGEVRRPVDVADVGLRGALLAGGGRLLAELRRLVDDDVIDVAGVDRGRFPRDPHRVYMSALESLPEALAARDPARTVLARARLSFMARPISIMPSTRMKNTGVTKAASRIATPRWSRLRTLTRLIQEGCRGGVPCRPLCDPHGCGIGRTSLSVRISPQPLSVVDRGRIPPAGRGVP